MGQCKCHFAATALLLGYLYLQKHDQLSFSSFYEDGFKVGTIKRLRNPTDPIINNLSCISIGFFLSFEIQLFKIYAIQIIFYKY